MNHLEPSVLRVLLATAAFSIVAVSLLVLAIYRRGFGSWPAFGWLMGLLYFLVTPLTIIGISGGWTVDTFYVLTWNRVDLTLDGDAWAFTIVCLLVLSALLGTLPGQHKSRPRAVSELGQSADYASQALIVCSLLALSKWMIYAALLGDVRAVILTGWLERTHQLTDQFGELGNYLLKLWQANLFILIGTCGALLLRFLTDTRPSRRLPAASIALVTVVLLIESALSGNRIYGAVLLVTMFAVLFMTRTTWALIFAFALMVPLALLSIIWRTTRGNLLAVAEGDIGSEWYDRLEAVLHGSDSLLLESFMEVTEGINAMVLIRVVESFSAHHDYLLGATYVKPLLAPIPRELFPEKPEVFSTTVAQLLQPETEGLSLASTILGEMWGNFGPVALLLAFVLSVIVVHVSLWSQRGPVLSKPEAQFALCGLLFWAVRMSLSDAVLTFLFMLVILVALHGLRALTLPPSAQTGTHGSANRTSIEHAPSP